MASAADFYAFRSEFVRSYAHTQFIQHLFLWACFGLFIARNPNTTPDKIVLDLKTGATTLLNARPNYRATEKAVAVSETLPVPFRLTYPCCTWLAALTPRATFAISWVRSTRRAASC